MNKIYKVIWSKVKNQYVVVSELAHSNGKQSKKSEKTVQGSLRALVAALMVGGSLLFMPYTALAAEINDNNGNTGTYEETAPTFNNAKDNINKGDENIFIYANENNVEGDKNKLTGESENTTDNNIITGDNNTLNKSQNNAIIGGIAEKVGHGSGIRDEGGNKLTSSNNNKIQGEQNELESSDNNTIIGGKLVVTNSYNGAVEGGNVLRNADSNTIIGDKNKIYEANNNSITGDSNILGAYVAKDGVYINENTIEGESNNIANGSNNVIVGNFNNVGRNDYTASDNNVISGDKNTVYAASSNTITGKSNKLTNANNNVITGNSNSVKTGNTSATSSDDNYIWGDSNDLQRTMKTWILGSENKFGTINYDSKDNLIFGSTNKFGSDVVNSLIFGNNNTAGTHGMANSILIGSDMTFGRSTDVENSIAIGQKINAPLGNDFILIGNQIDTTKDGKDTSDEAVVIGMNTGMVSDRATMLGFGTSADEGSVSIGLNAQAIGDNSVAIGPEARTAAWNSVAIGYDSETGENSGYAIALGRSSAVAKNSNDAIAIGSYAFVGENATSSIVIGAQGKYGGSEGGSIPEDHAGVNNGAEYSIAMGASSMIGTNAKHSIAIGGTKATIGENTENATAIGSDAAIGKSSSYSTVYGAGSSIGNNVDEAVAVGAKVIIDDEVDYATALGSESTVDGNLGLAAGYKAQALADNSTAIGSNSIIDATSTGSATLGNNTSIGANSVGAIAIGGDPDTTDKETTAATVGNNADNAIAIGTSTNIADGAKYGIALGSSSSANGEWATALGSSSDANYQATAVGANAQALGDNSVAIGTNSLVTNKKDDGTDRFKLDGITLVTTDNSIALGFNSKVTADDIFTDEDRDTYVKNHNELWNIKDADKNGVVSVGDNGTERRIINVAKGRVDETSTDAINGSQLYALADDLNTKIDNAGGDWNLTTSQDSNSTTVGKNNTVDFAGKTEGEGETAHQNIHVTQTSEVVDGKQTGNTEVTFDLDDKLVLGNNNQITIDGSNGNATINLGDKIALDGVEGTATIGGVTIESTYNSDGSVSSSTINNLTNKEWDNTNQTQYADSGRAATEAQLYDAIGNATAGMYKGWTASAEGSTGVAVPSGSTVDFAGKKGTDKNGAEYQNIVVSQEAPNSPNLKFDLNDKVVLGEGDNQIILDGITGNATFNNIIANSANIGNTVINNNGVGITVDGTTKYYITKDGLNANGNKITNVQAGTENTDAVNVSQLNQAINGTYGGWTVSTNSGEGTAVPSKGKVDFSSVDNAESTKNIVIGQDGLNLTFDLSDRLVLGDSSQVVIDGINGSAFFGGINGININGSAGTISGLSNIEWTYENYKNNVYLDSNKAATEAQLHDAFGYLDNKIDNIETGGSGSGTGSTTVDKDDDNITVRPGGDGEADYNIGLDNDIALGGDIDNDGVINPEEEGSFAVTKGDGSTISINNDFDGDGRGDGVISGLTNTEWDYDKYQNGGYAESSNGATEAQLHQAMQGAVQYDRNEDGTINKGSITLGGDEGTTIHNVAPGKVSADSTDAINGSQLYGVQQQVKDNSTAISSMGNQINRLGDRIDKVGAGAAALAALHPLDFDPDDKLSFAAGYGNYAGENAVAIGAFYQPNEDTLFSVGGTVGNDENMVNVGVSFKLGQKNHVSNNRVAMAKEIISLRDKMAQLEALLAHQGVLPQSQIDTSRLFPDIPENHWAYEYVHELAKLGIVEGYANGNYEGDRMMTRYEMAAIVYRAMQKGVNVDSRMVKEFEPELKLIRVDVVAKDKDGNPTIERVRVNDEATQQA